MLKDVTVHRIQGHSLETLPSLRASRNLKEQEEILSLPLANPALAYLELAWAVEEAPPAS